MPPAKPALIFGVYPRVSAMLGFDNGPLRQLHVHSLLCRIQVSPCQIMRRVPKIGIDEEKTKVFETHCVRRFVSSLILLD